MPDQEEADTDYYTGGVKYDEVQDSRNHLTLVRDDFLPYITRLTPRQVAIFARYKVVAKHLNLKLIGTWVDYMCRYAVSTRGEGRTEIVEAMKGDRIIMDSRDAMMVPGYQTQQPHPQPPTQKRRLLGRGLRE